MAKNTSISVGDHFKMFIESQIQSGRYGSASEVVRAGLRVLEEQEANLAAFKKAVLDGVQSGPSTPFDFDAFMERKRAEFDKSQIQKSR